MEVKTKREAVIELVNKLFIYTDSRQWHLLIKDVFKEKVYFDSSSLDGAPAMELVAGAICDRWREGLKDIDHVHHHTGNFIVDFYNEEVQAKVFCYATASHFKESASRGKTREFVGAYELHASFTDFGWRIDKFRYDLKYITGNTELV
ncbi:MAG TPA: nuclear transport factor 2 family protein [Chryseosolibacter sp.]